MALPSEHSTAPETGHRHPHGHAHGVASHAPLPFDPTALISARGVSLTRSGRTLLEDIDFDISAGEIVTVIGPNGSGKTTLVRVLLGLIAPDTGEIRRHPDLRVGYAPQRFDVDQAIPMTVERFLRLGTPASDQMIAKVLDEVGTSGKGGRQISNLSGGEFQRVLLARALLRKPTLLVLDEPVRGVDYIGEADLYDLIGRLRDTHGLGVLLISHDLHVVMARSTRVVCVNRHVCCSGVPQAVARHPEYVRLFGQEAAGAFAIYQHEHDHRHDLAGHSGPASSKDR
ncbi:MAG: ATP-binding cassette domain-containing protein [Hyphomicrobiaceae bacterium]